MSPSPGTAALPSTVVPAGKPLPEEVKDKAVELYLDGVTTSEITERLGIPRSTLFWVLKQKGIPTNRTRRREADLVLNDGTIVELKALVESHENRISIMNKAIEQQFELIRRVIDLAADSNKMTRDAHKMLLAFLQERNPAVAEQLARELEEENKVQ